MKPSESNLGQNDTRNDRQPTEKRNRKKDSLSKALRGVPRGKRGQAIRDFRHSGGGR